MALARADDGDDGDDDDGGDDGAAEEVLAGYVQLHMPDSESGPMRGHVQKLFVGTEFRRQGVARALMGRVEGVARGRGRWNLVSWVFFFYRKGGAGGVLLLLIMMLGAFDGETESG